MHNESPAELIPVTLLTGFLGSGKTTVLNHLVSQPEMADALVIINEFGEMALDHLLVAHSTENLVMEMSSGCLCCTIRGDLVKTLRDITWRFARNGERQFRRVLIETTGLADPAPIIHTLMTDPQIAPKYRLDGIVAVVDMATGTHTLNQHPEAIKQAVMADVLLFTKPDLASDAQKIELMQRLAAINPAAPRWEVRDGKIDPAQVLNLGLYSPENKTLDVERWLKEEAYIAQAPHVHHHAEHEHQHYPDHTHTSDNQHHHDHHDINRHDDRIRCFCFSVDAPIPDEILNAWLEVLMSFLGSQILRVKGILNIEGHTQPVAIHGVQHILHPPVALPAWPTEDRRSRLVFITQDISRDAIEASFQAFGKVLPQAGKAPT